MLKFRMREHCVDDPFPEVVISISPIATLIEGRHFSQSHAEVHNNTPHFFENMLIDLDLLLHRRSGHEASEVIELLASYQKKSEVEWARRVPQRADVSAACDDA